MNIESFGKIITLIYMNVCHVRDESFVLVDNQINLLEVVKGFLM